MIEMLATKVYITHIEKHTEKAILVGLDDGFKIDYVWFPKSQVYGYYGNKAKDGTIYNKCIVVPTWLAKENGIFAKTHDGNFVYNFHTSEMDI